MSLSPQLCPLRKESWEKPLPSLQGWCCTLTCSDVPGVAAPLGSFFRSSSSFSPSEKGSLEETFGSFSPLHQNLAAFVEGSDVTHPNTKIRARNQEGSKRTLGGKKFPSAHPPSRKSSLALSNVL